MTCQPQRSEGPVDVADLPRDAKPRSVAAEIVGHAGCGDTSRGEADLVHRPKLGPMLDLLRETRSAGVVQSISRISP